MKKYEVKSYERGGWVIVEVKSGREIILFNDQEKVEDACRFLNEEES